MPKPEQMKVCFFGLVVSLGKVSVSPCFPTANCAFEIQRAWGTCYAESGGCVRFRHVLGADLHSNRFCIGRLRHTAHYVLRQHHCALKDVDFMLFSLCSVRERST